MATIERTRIRTAVDVISARTTELTDELTDSPLKLWQAEDVQVEVGIFKDGTIAADISNFDSVTMVVKDPDNLLGSPLIEKTVEAADLDQNVSLANWDNGTEQHVLFELTFQETNIELQGRNKRDLLIFFWATTDDVEPRRIPLGTSKITLLDSGYGDVGAITIVPAGARIRNSKLQILNQTDGLYYDLVIRNSAEGIAVTSVEGAGES